MLNRYEWLAVALDGVRTVILGIGYKRDDAHNDAISHLQRWPEHERRGLRESMKVIGRTQAVDAGLLRPKQRIWDLSEIRTGLEYCNRTK